MGRNAPSLFHLFLANDCLLFSQDSNEGVLILKKIIEEYERVLGQKINVQKVIYFLLIIDAK